MHWRKSVLRQYLTSDRKTVLPYQVPTPRPSFAYISIENRLVLIQCNSIPTTIRTNHTILKGGFRHQPNTHGHHPHPQLLSSVIPPSTYPSHLFTFHMARQGTKPTHQERQQPETALNACACVLNKVPLDQWFRVLAGISVFHPLQPSVARTTYARSSKQDLDNTF